jgi:hypothetical protein
MTWIEPPEYLMICPKCDEMNEIGWQTDIWLKITCVGCGITFNGKYELGNRIIGDRNEFFHN